MIDKPHNLLADNEDGLDGLSQLSALLKRSAQPLIGETLDFRLVEIERGRAAFEGTPSTTVYNPIGSGHGGYAATLLDSACGCAVHASLAARRATPPLS